MKLIISATNRKGSLSLQVSHIVKGIYQELKEPCEVLDLKSVDFQSVINDPYPETLPSGLKPACDRVLDAEALVIVCPEYNGSFPGILKFFIDHWHYPGSFVHKPVCLIGLGGRFGALRPLEQLAGIFFYRNSFLFPERVFISQITEVLKKGCITDSDLLVRLKTQAENFIKFTKALKEADLC